MKRREFIAGLGGAAAAWPVAARAQQSVPRVGFLSSRSLNEEPRLIPAFREGLKDTGFVEGQNVTIHYHWVEGQFERLAALATDLVGSGVSAIVAGGLPAVRAAKAATDKIPIVFLIATDPVELGLAASLNRPGTNLTGVTSLGTELTGKRLEILHLLLPTAKITALLINSSNTALAENQVRDMRGATKTLGLQLHILHARSDTEISEAFAKLRMLRAEMLVIAPDGFLLSRIRALAEMSARYNVPAIFQNQQFAVAGGLVSYGPESVDLFRQLGVQAGRVLSGANPVELPIIQAAKLEMIINLKASKALGIDVPLSLLARADEVIE